MNADTGWHEVMLLKRTSGNKRWGVLKLRFDEAARINIPAPMLLKGGAGFIPAPTSEVPLKYIPRALCLIEFLI